MESKSKKITVAIADDHTIFREGLRRLLEVEEDISVIAEAADGAEAVAVVQESQPDILLLDLAMPRMPGLDALRELNLHPAATRTLLLTAAIDHRQIVEALHAGAYGVVMKDSASQILLQAIRAVVNGSYWVGRDLVRDKETYLREQQPAQPRARVNYGLTRRETEILETIVTGLSNKEIAQRFSLSEDTVKHHLTNIFDKVGVSSRLELALFAINNRLTE
jgi:DNA-binding NarL/FixJ family response regulator